MLSSQQIPSLQKSRKMVKYLIKYFLFSIFFIIHFHIHFFQLMLNWASKDKFFLSWLVSALGRHTLGLGIGVFRGFFGDFWDPNSPIPIRGISNPRVFLDLARNENLIPKPPLLTDSYLAFSCWKDSLIIHVNYYIGAIILYTLYIIPPLW